MYCGILDTPVEACDSQFIMLQAFNRDNECHGWLGLKYQSAPRYVSAHPQLNASNISILILISAVTTGSSRSRLPEHS